MSMQKDEFYHMHKMWSRHTNIKMTYVRRYTWDTDSWTLATEWCKLGMARKWCLQTAIRGHKYYFPIISFVLL